MMLQIIRTSSRRSISNITAVSIVLAFVVLGVGVAALYLSQTGNPTTSTTSTTSAQMVRVFGLVSTTGAGTHPTAMAFLSVTTKQLYVAPITGNSFSIQLPNKDTYNVSTRWAGNYSWQSGEVQRGQLPINMSEGSMMAQSYNVVEVTPNAVLQVKGTVAWQMVTSQPSSIKFTARNGQEFVGTVASDKTFAINLPNMMTYEVNIGTENSSGYTEWYYAHQLEVNAGARIIGLIVDLS